MTEATETGFHRRTLPGGVGLSILPTRKLKTIQAQIYLGGNLDEAFTRRALLPSVLERGTSRFPDLQAMQRQREELYGASVSGNVMKSGEWHILKFRLETVNGRFLPGTDPDRMFDDGLSFLRDLIFDPRLDGEQFRQAEFEQEKSNLERQIASLIDHKDHYSFERLIEHMCAREPFHRHEYGTVAHLEALTREELTGFWREVCAGAPREIFIEGDLDVDATAERVAEIFEGQRPLESRTLWEPPAPRVPDGVREVTENLEVNQARLCLGYRTGSNYREGDLEAMVMLNGILGAFSHSKLFQNVREKESLAYDVHSYLEKSKGLLFVLAGVASEKVEQARAIIERQVDDLARGEISDLELLATRESLDNHLVLMEDNLGALAEVDYLWRLNGQEFDLESYRARLREVGRDRIQEAARQLRLDTVFVLDQ